MKQILSMSWEWFSTRLLKPRFCTLCLILEWVSKASFLYFTAVTLMGTVDGCHQQLTDSSLYLLSSNYPWVAKLPRGLDCIYTITLPWDRRIALYWEFFNLGYNCDPARLEVSLHRIFYREYDHIPQAICVWIYSRLVVHYWNSTKIAISSHLFITTDGHS